MAGDGILSIGAVFDKDGVDTGMTDMAALTKSTMASITAAVEQAGQKTRNAFRGLSDDVKAAAASVSTESLKVAEATKAQASALADLHRAVVISRDAKLDEATSTSILAAAQRKAATSSEELAAVKKAEADAIEEAAERIGLSSNFIVAGFQRAEAAVSESLAGMRERLVLTGETAHLSARDMTSAFSGLGELLGVGLLAGFAGDYLDDLAKMQVELGHLRIETGLSAKSLAGLKEIVKEAGSDWEPIERGLVHLARALDESSMKMPEYVRALQAVGITWEDLKGKTPEQELNMLSAAFANTANKDRVAYAAQELFGRGGLALIPILKEQGAQLAANMEQIGALTGVTDKTVEASERWQRDTARLSIQFQSIMMPVIEHAGDVISGVAGDFELAAFVIVDGFEAIATAVVTAGQGVYGFGKLLFDATTGNFASIAGDVEQLRNRVVDTWRDGFKDIENGWKEVASRFVAPAPIPPMTAGVDPGDQELPAKPKKERGAGNAAFRADDDALNQLKLDHQLTLGEEIRFWEQKLATARKGSEEYREIIKKLVDLDKQLGKDKDVSISTEILFWQVKLDVAKKGTKEYAEIVKKLVDLDHQLGSQKLTLQTTSDDQGLKAAEDAFMEANRNEAKSSEEAARQEVEAFREAREEEIRLAQERYQEVERDSEQEVEMGRMTQGKRIEMLRQAAIHEEQIQMQAVRALEMADMQNVQRYQADLNKEEQITRQAMEKIKNLNNLAALQIANDWKRVFTQLNTDITQLTADWMRGTRNMGQQFAKMFNDTLIELTEWVEKWLLKKAEMWAESKIIDAAGAAAQKAAQAASNVATVTGAAAVGAAVTTAYYAATDPPAAPAAGAAMMAVIEAFAPMAAFDAGGIVDGSRGMAVPILAHAGERVLTPEQTHNFESLVNNNSSNSSNLTQHLHYEPKVNAYDRSGMRSTLKSHAEDILDIVRAGYRAGKLA